MDKLLESIISFVAKRPAVTLAVAAAAIAAIAVSVLWNQGPEYQTLYAQLSDEDSGAVIEKLKEKRIPYSVDGSTISVPADKVYETRMELAGEGLPQGGGVGFEIFDKTSFGVTDFVQKVNYKRALQGELARTIAQIKEVESARVHLALPEKGVFLDEQKKARASVIVKLKPGKELSQGQVSSIVHLVANSTDNLKPQDVAVVDTAGRMWTRESGGENPLILSSTQLEYKKGIENDYEQRLQSMLEKAVGVNKVVARVSAEVDTKHVERTEERFDPDGQVVRSEQRGKEKSIGGTVALGVPGVLSNMPETAQAQAPANSTPSQSQRQDEVINYEISKVTSHVVEPIGSIKRLTVSVLVDGTYQTVKDADGKEARNYTPRADDELAKYTEMVKGAVGFDESRGDVISVVSAPFEQETSEAEVVATEKEYYFPPQLVPVAMKYGTVLLITALTLIFVVRPIMKRLMQERAALEEIQHKLPHALAAGQGGAMLDAGTDADKDSVNRLKGVVKENPQQVAMVLKNWIKEK
ncbi:MAG TPA: flagellar M-ring protein FliF [Deltaproteobacteria bacterium]|nr:MAG: flagellar M-ring protein FliF [Deltaproteobacteria bacterium GWA2_55_82]OGQ64445.1 MAG: flagellar M-ring protein FliF [Deltaproteobacteria bacterium RIFCSPLOWO2_02_FULL_55_12]OIJ72827.1 MAG: flagellar M-ring protein FliF [Deltaproteobacteria bacterium GWC2_55_46]HBG46105.1 flagellar M-ring protein FliF [Deltaproteobacteria bacterium]HCY11603.1 flagellar M-ring protein FliF [Deltaproteobacteria bacterium]